MPSANRGTVVGLAASTTRHEAEVLL